MQSIFLFVVLGLLSFIPLTTHAAAELAEPKVVLVVLDGVRSLEIQSKAVDDNGKRVSAESLFPNLMALKKRGIYLSNMRITNPVGISLPAYSDIFAGRRQEKITNNDPKGDDFKSHYPTIFEVVKKGLNLGSDGVAVHSSWVQNCPIAVSDPSVEFYRSCGWKEDTYIRPEIYKGSRADSDTFLEFAREVPKRKPRFVFVHMGDADEEAHLQETVKEKTGQHYGIFTYHNTLRQYDYYVGRIWSLLQLDPYYKDSTYLIVSTDHGRDDYPDSKQWANHGRCVRKHGAKFTCTGCSSVFALAVGPGLKRRTVANRYYHTDLAPTIARLFGLTMSTSDGKVIREIVR